MAAFDYSGVIATAKSLINKFGKTIYKISTIPPINEWEASTDGTPIAVKGVMIAYKNNEIDGTLIKATDKKILTYDEVSVGDKIKDEEVHYNVVNVDTIAPANDKLLYKVQVRK